MFDELNKYNHSDKVFFSTSDNLREVCNAPTDKGGVYVFYAVTSRCNELIYIGRSGKAKSDGIMFIRQGGLKDRLVNGKQFYDEPRWKCLGRKMVEDKIEKLRIHWYVTHNDNFIDCPRGLEKRLLRRYVDIYGRLPRWNKEL